MLIKPRMLWLLSDGLRHNINLSSGQKYTKWVVAKQRELDNTERGMEGGCKLGISEE